MSAMNTSRPGDGPVEFQGHVAAFNVEFTLGGAERVIKTTPPLPIITSNGDGEERQVALVAQGHHVTPNGVKSLCDHGGHFNEEGSLMSHGVP